MTFSLWDGKVRAIVAKHGGQWHGPHVEHLSMAETKFYAMLNDPEFAEMIRFEHSK